MQRSADLIRLTVHALEMIEERKIDPAWVEATVLVADWTTPDPRDHSLTRSYRMIDAADGRVLRVVHRADGPDRLVITAHFDRGARA